MRFENDSVIFESQDMHFVQRFGPVAASDMVMDYLSEHYTPFIYDVYQLACLLELPVRDLRRILSDIPAYYRVSHIPKRSGGWREISHPLSPLSEIQRVILHRILYRLPCSPYARAYFPCASLEANAQPHVGKRYLLKMDITDFFGSLRFDRIISSVFNTALYPKQIGAMLTSLCCLNDVLPQGACTSPAVSNLVMRGFDDTFGRWCGARGLSYTRYCDDITVSGGRSLYPAYRKASELLAEMELEVNEKKTRFITAASRQTVTGLTVNERVGVPSDYKRRLRQELYYVDRYGVADAARCRHLTDAKKYYQQLMGRLNYVLSIERDHAYFIKAKERLRAQRPALHEAV